MHALTTRNCIFGYEKLGLEAMPNNLQNGKQQPKPNNNNNNNNNNHPGSSSRAQQQPPHHNSANNNNGVVAVSYTHLTLPTIYSV